MANLLERMSVARRKEEKRRGRESHPFNDRKDGSSGGEAEEAEEEEEEEDGNGEAKRRESELSNFSKHVENERYKGVKKNSIFGCYDEKQQCCTTGFKNKGRGR